MCCGRRWVLHQQVIAGNICVVGVDGEIVNLLSEDV